MSAKIKDTEMSWYPTESFPGKSAGASALSSVSPKIRSWDGGAMLFGLCHSTVVARCSAWWFMIPMREVHSDEGGAVNYGMRRIALTIGAADSKRLLTNTYPGGPYYLANNEHARPKYPDLEN